MYAYVQRVTKAERIVRGMVREHLVEPAKADGVKAVLIKEFAS